MAFFQSSTPVPVLVLTIFLVQTLCIIKWNQALRHEAHTFVSLVNIPELLLKLCVTSEPCMVEEDNDI